MNTFRNRQSSFVLGGPSSDASCGHGLPNAVAFRIPSQAGCGRGGRQRSAPTGGAAYGIPRKLRIPAVTFPRTAPAAVTTTTAPGVVAASLTCSLVTRKPPAAIAATNAPATVAMMTISVRRPRLRP